MDGGGASTQTNRKRLYKQSHFIAYKSLFIIIISLPHPHPMGSTFQSDCGGSFFLSLYLLVQIAITAQDFSTKDLGEDIVTMNSLLKRIIFTFFVVQMCS